MLKCNRNAEKVDEGFQLRDSSESEVDMLGDGRWWDPRTAREWEAKSSRSALDHGTFKIIPGVVSRRVTIENRTCIRKCRASTTRR